MILATLFTAALCGSILFAAFAIQRKYGGPPVGRYLGGKVQSLLAAPQRRG